MIRWMVLLPLFCLDIRVNADPEVYAHTKRDFESPGVKVTMEAGSLLENRGGEAVHLVRGHFLLRLSDATTVRTPFATLGCAAETCLALVRRDADRVSIKALKGEFMVRRLGDKQHYSLIAGAQTFVGAVTTGGAADMDFPQALPWDSTVKEWAKFFSGTMKEFKPTLVQFREDWKLAVEKLSQVHNTFAARTIASHEEAVAAEAARKAAQDREDAKLRKLFREKTLGR